MIPNSDLIKKISERLSESEIVSFLPNTSYSFVIYENEGEYKKPIKEANHVNKFINCVASVIEDNKIGINAETMTLSKTMKLDILIPDATVIKDGESFSNYVISFINSAFNLPYSDNEVYDNMLYNVVGVFSTVTPGTKEIRPSAGESLTVSVFIDWVISALGYSSDKVKLYITPPTSLANPNPERTQIFYSRLDICRTTTQESNVQSDSRRSVSKSVDISTALVVSIVKPDRIDYLDRQITSYLLNENRPKLTITLGWPHKVLDNLEPSEYTSEFTMTFREACKGAQGLDIPSNTCTLVELLEV